MAEPKRLSKKVIVILLVVLIGGGILICAGIWRERTKNSVPSGYNRHDYEKVVSFLEQKDEAGVKNGTKINKKYNRNDPSTWTYQDGSLTRGVNWTDSKSNKRVLTVDFDSKEGLCGNLDLRDCTELKEVYSQNGKLTELHVEGCSALESVWCGNNQLHSLDLSTNKKLWNLVCDSNSIKELNLNENTELKGLLCMDNNLITLDVTNNPKLTTLFCWNNKLAQLDISKNPKLASLDCRKNQLKELNTTENPELTDITCSKNSIETMDISKNPVLTYLDASENQLTSLELQENKLLEKLYCNKNKLKELDLSSAVKLAELDCAENLLTQLEIPTDSVIPVHLLQSEGNGNIGITYKIGAVKNEEDTKDPSVSSGSEQSFSATTDNQDMSETVGDVGSLADTDESSVEQIKNLIAIPNDTEGSFLGWYTSDGKLLSKEKSIQMDDFKDVTDFIARFQ